MKHTSRCTPPQVGHLWWQRIDAIADEALELMKAFDAATEEHLVTLGISKEQIDNDTKRLLREWIEGV